MPIYEFACPRCRAIYSLFSKRIQPDREPACPKCGGKDLRRLLSPFSALKGAKEPSPAPGGAGDGGPPGPDLDDPKVLQAMQEIERDMGQMDENNPRHMARLMRKMKEAMPPGTLPPEMDTAIRRLEAGEDPEKVEADLGDLMGNLPGGPGGGGDDTSGYARDGGLYDY